MPTWNMEIKKKKIKEKLVLTKKKKIRLGYHPLDTFAGLLLPIAVVLCADMADERQTSRPLKARLAKELPMEGIGVSGLVESLSGVGKDLSTFVTEPVVGRLLKGRKHRKKIP